MIIEDISARTGPAASSFRPFWGNKILLHTLVTD